MPHADAPQVAAEATLAMEANDCVIVGTDGLFDNLFDDEIVAIVDKHAGEWAAGGASPDHAAAVARDLGQAAHSHSLDEKRNGPFAVNALAHGLRFDGGKPDDITVVVGILVADVPKARL